MADSHIDGKIAVSYNIYEDDGAPRSPRLMNPVGGGRAWLIIARFSKNAVRKRA